MLEQDMGEHEEEVRRGERFEFGANWRRFLSVLTEDRIRQAEEGLTRMLGRSDLTGLSFLDVGSGSGLSSLVARRLGATVRSFDYDPQSVACTEELKRRFFDGDPQWTVERGSALDEAYLATLGTYDIVYSWGVLHHTGEMWRALDLVSRLVKPDGLLFVAIYNDQGAWSGRWKRIKRLYNSGFAGKMLVSSVAIPWWVMRGAAADVVWLRNPLSRYRSYGRERGMSMTHDWHDWLGGYPFEYAKPEVVFDFFRQRGFTLQRLATAGGSVGCNEFVFHRVNALL
jgi:2-polyprenyl-6-hydroxyphenyl methylase/3-demethylubiquinone-9 3-methyltransferase